MNIKNITIKMFNKINRIFIKYKWSIIISLAGLIFIIIGQILFNPIPKSNNYEFWFDTLSGDGKYAIGDLNLEYNSYIFKRDFINLTLAVRTIDNQSLKYFYIDYPENLTIDSVILRSDGVLLKDYNEYNISSGGGRYRFEIYKELPKDRSGLEELEIEAIFRGNLTPQGTFGVFHSSKGESGLKYVSSNPIGVKNEIMRFKLGDVYRCSSPCISSTIEDRPIRTFNLYNNRKEEVIVSQDDNNRRNGVAILINTINKINELIRGILESIGAGLIAGAILLWFKIYGRGREINY